MARTPTVVPEEVFDAQSPDVQKLLRQWADLHAKPRTPPVKRALKAVRDRLRKRKFKLSLLATGSPFPAAAEAPVKTTTITLDEDLHTELRIRSIREKRTASAIVSDALKRYLTEE